MLRLSGAAPAAAYGRLVGVAHSIGYVVEEDYLPGERNGDCGFEDRREFPPALNVETLTGLQVPRNRKVRCPFQADRRPSLHVYEDPARGWYCYGCRRGGSVSDFPGCSGYPPSRDEPLRGKRFIEVRDRLSAIFLWGAVGVSLSAAQLP